jgi:hypothetical protein
MSSALVTLAFLIAETDPLGDFFMKVILGLLFLGGALAVAIALVSRAIEHQRLAKRHGEQLLDEIGRAHGLTFSQRRLLVRVAVRSGIPHPSLVAIFPSYFTDGCQNLRPNARTQKKLEFIRQQLFG